MVNHLVQLKKELAMRGASSMEIRALEVQNLSYDGKQLSEALRIGYDFNTEMGTNITNNHSLSTTYHGLSTMTPKQQLESITATTVVIMTSVLLALGSASKCVFLHQYLRHENSNTVSALICLGLNLSALAGLRTVSVMGDGATWNVKAMKSYQQQTQTYAGGNDIQLVTDHAYRISRIHPLYCSFRIPRHFRLSNQYFLLDDSHVLMKSPLNHIQAHTKRIAFPSVPLLGLDEETRKALGLDDDVMAVVEDGSGEMVEYEAETSVDSEVEDNNEYPDEVACDEEQEEDDDMDDTEGQDVVNGGLVS